MSKIFKTVLLTCLVAMLVAPVAAHAKPVAYPQAHNIGIVKDILHRILEQKKSFHANLTVADKNVGGTSFTLRVNIHNIPTEVYALDLILKYSEQIEIVSAESIREGFPLLGDAHKESQSRYIMAGLGKGNAISGITSVLEVKVETKVSTTASEVLDMVRINKIDLADGEGNIHLPTIK